MHATIRETRGPTCISTFYQRGLGKVERQVLILVVHSAEGTQKKELHIAASTTSPQHCRFMPKACYWRLKRHRWPTPVTKTSPLSPNSTFEVLVLNLTSARTVFLAGWITAMPPGIVLQMRPSTSTRKPSEAPGRPGPGVKSWPSDLESSTKLRTSGSASDKKKADHDGPSFALLQTHKKRPSFEIANPFGRSSSFVTNSTLPFRTR
mmetsp:Transcript_61821/g.166231  ORF Transcript_61821/g.166231 Transcript_61821/m.166231 type:complete len:207 (+) Transcript_61821:230-850(+)